jgi:hypothetical protein
MRTAFLALFLFACTGADAGGVPPGQRLVTGHLVLTDAGTVRRAAQLVALFAVPGDACPAGSLRTGSAAAGVSACASFGEPFAPDGEARFRLLLPCDLTVNLLVQTLGDSGGQSPGDALAVLAYPTGVGADETTTLLARELACRDTAELATVVLDLGYLAVSALPTPDGAPRPLIVGGPGGGQNPLATIDTDGDFTANLADPDDDEDGIADADDPDRDGDEQADGAQAFAPAWLAR